MDPGTSQLLSLLLLCWRCPLQHHTSAQTHTRAHIHKHESIHAVLIRERKKIITDLSRKKKKKKEVHCEPGLLVWALFSTPVGPQFILQFSSMLQSHDDNTRLVVSLSRGLHICLLPGLATQSFFHRESRHILAPSRSFSHFRRRGSEMVTCLLNLLIKEGGPVDAIMCVFFP